MATARTARAVLVVLAVLAVALNAAMILPFAAPLLVGAVLAGALEPLTAGLARRLGNRRALAAGLVTLAVVAVLVIPLGWLGSMLVPQVVDGVGWIQGALRSEGVAGLLSHLPPSLRGAAQSLAQDLPDAASLQALVRDQGSRFAGAIRDVLQVTGVFLGKTLLFLIALYFLLADGPRLVRWVDEAVPLKRGQVAELLSDFRSATVALMVSSLATAGVQTGLATVGYLVAGLPNVLFLALVTFLVGLVPGVGATPAILVLALLQFAADHARSAAVLLAVAVPVSLVDNFLKPLIMRSGLAVHPAVIFLSLLGGVAAFGVVGILLGPISLAFLLAVIRMYRRDYEA